MSKLSKRLAKLVLICTFLSVCSHRALAQFSSGLQGTALVRSTMICETHFARGIRAWDQTQRSRRSQPSLRFALVSTQFEREAR